MSSPPINRPDIGPDVGVDVVDEPGAEVFASVSLRELQVALQAARASQLARSTAPLVTQAAAPAVAADGSRRRGAGGDQAGGASRTGGRLAPPPAETAPSSLVLLAAHGGSGADCLAQVLDTARVTRTWPNVTAPESAADVSPTSVAVVLVCRSDARGLARAQELAREYRDANWTDRIRLLGAAVVADAPGRLPTPLRRRQRLLAAAVPQVWCVPWVPAWRLGPPDPAQPPDWAVRMREELTAAMRG